LKANVLKGNGKAHSERSWEEDGNIRERKEKETRKL
jgi:hypothetical protein